MTEAETLAHIRKAVQDIKLHDHDREDWFCLNLQSWLGERAGWLLARLNERDERIIELERQIAGPTPELPAITLPWSGVDCDIEVAEDGDILLTGGAGTAVLDADEATEVAAALLAAVAVSRDITGERPTITLHAPALTAQAAAEPSSLRWELQVAGRFGSWTVRRGGVRSATSAEALARLAADAHLEDRPAELRDIRWRVLVGPVDTVILTPETAAAIVDSSPAYTGPAGLGGA